MKRPNARASLQSQHHAQRPGVSRASLRARQNLPPRRSTTPRWPQTPDTPTSWADEHRTTAVRETARAPAPPQRAITYRRIGNHARLVPQAAPHLVSALAVERCRIAALEHSTPIRDLATGAQQDSGPSRTLAQQCLARPEQKAPAVRPGREDRGGFPRPLSSLSTTKRETSERCLAPWRPGGASRSLWSSLNRRSSSSCPFAHV